MKLHKLTALAFVFLVFIFQGCATLKMSQYEAVSERPEEYARFFKYLDKAVDEAGVQDASHFPVPGFPYLRTDRFLAALQDRIVTEAQKELWLRWMQRHNLVAREKEIRNLPVSAFKHLASRLGEPPDRKAVIEKMSFYSEMSLIHDRGQPDFYDALRAAQNVPDEYSLTMRTLGLYPLWALPVALATNHVYNEFRGWHNTPLEDLKIDGNLKTYAPPRQVLLSEPEMIRIFGPSNRSVLGVPELSDEEIEMLVKAYAPIIQQDVVADYDSLGHIVWYDGRVRVNPRKPAVYYYMSYAFYKNEPVLQLNYVFWYSARNGPNPPWIETGPLDGITLRITFDPEGQPFMADIQNNCGCYYFLIPRKERVRQIIPQPVAIDLLVPAYLPQFFPEKRLHLRINSGWHQVQRVVARKMPHDALTYELLPYDTLEMLPQSDSRTESIFTAHGIAKDSSRVEPLIFFPSGIHNIGSMRQRGHHAIKLVGRAHFDDPHLFDNNFKFN